MHKLFPDMIRRRREKRVLGYFAEWSQRVDVVPPDPRDQWDEVTRYISHRLLEDLEGWSFTRQMRAEMGLPPPRDC